MNRLFIIVFLTLNISIGFSQDSANLIILKGNSDVYIHTLNKFKIDESLFANKEIKVSTDNGTITKYYKGNYAVKPSSFGGCNISIYDAKNMKKLYEQSFTAIEAIRPTIIPYYYSEDGYSEDYIIPKDRLEDLKGFITTVFSQHSIIYFIDSYEIQLHQKGKAPIIYQVVSSISDEIRSDIQNLKEGDFIVFKSILINSVTDWGKKKEIDQSFYLSPTVFFIE